GEIRLSLDKLEDLAGVPDALKGQASLVGMLTANEEKASIRNAEFAAGKLKGAGALDITGIKEQNPLSVTGRFDLASSVNIDALLQGLDKGSGKAAGGGNAKSDKTAAAAKAASPVPQTMTLPFPLSLDVAFSAPELSMSGQSLKNVTLSLAK